MCEKGSWRPICNRDREARMLSGRVDCVFCSGQLPLGLESSSIISGVYLGRDEWSQCFGREMSYREGFHVGISSAVMNISQVCVTRGHFALDVVALAEECEPVVENLDVFWFEIFPLWPAFLLLQRRLCESSGCVFASKDCNR